MEHGNPWNLCIIRDYHDCYNEWALLVFKNISSGDGGSWDLEEMFRSQELHQRGWV